MSLSKNAFWISPFDIVIIIPVLNELLSLSSFLNIKKTKKQKLEGKTMNPIICIGNYYTDKKMRELMKVCNVFELKTPKNNEINTIISNIIPKFKDLSKDNVAKILSYIQGDLRKLNFVINILNDSNTDISSPDSFIHIFQTKNFNANSVIQLRLPLGRNWYINVTVKSLKM